MVGNTIQISWLKINGLSFPLPAHCKEDMAPELTVFNMIYKTVLLKKSYIKMDI
jgi:hypothetical protein